MSNGDTGSSSEIVKLKPFAVLAVAMVFTAACQSFGVKPWEREILSRPSMEFGNDELDLKMDDHFYFSKEGISGGRGFSGGGCGCN
jgi:hypothetical protein